MYNSIKDIPNEEIISYWLQQYQIPASKDIYEKIDNFVLTEVHRREPNLEIDALRVLRAIVHLNIDKTRFGITKEGIKKLKTNEAIKCLADLTQYPQENGIMSGLPDYLCNFLLKYKFAKALNNGTFKLNPKYLYIDWDFDESKPIEFQN